ncbi:DUF2914 domain-containing protein [bacterium]|nr:DUF2914 domain-containing protein [bacterium]
MLEQINTLYTKHQKQAQAFSFFVGFLWDTWTLGRIDKLSDNLIILLYTVLLGTLIILSNLVNYKIITSKYLVKIEDWYSFGIQFFFGSLFSSYVVFYFQSVSFTKTALFFLLLIFVFIGNEFLAKNYNNLYLQLLLYFLVTLSFFIFAIPVFFKVMNAFTFVFSCVLSLAVCLGMLSFLHKKIPELTTPKLRLLLAGFFLVVNLFYFLNLIPPVPLSLKTGMICHFVKKVESSYVLKIEKPKLKFWEKFNSEVSYTQGDTIYCFTSVFAPTELNKNIYHEWEFYKNGWQTAGRIPYSIKGGREGGYRGFTFKKQIFEGEWRVNVETEEGLLLGRINFTVKNVGKKTDLKTIKF